MNPRLNPYQAAPEAMKALLAFENYVQQNGLDHSLIDLVKTRASQINGCAYCIHIHTGEARDTYGGGARSRRDRGAPLFTGRMA
jgi:AhpD family alkylhydroperoxidase